MSNSVFYIFLYIIFSHKSANILTSLWDRSVLLQLVYRYYVFIKVHSTKLSLELQPGQPGGTKLWFLKTKQVEQSAKPTRLLLNGLTSSDSVWFQPHRKGQLGIHRNSAKVSSCQRGFTPHVQQKYWPIKGASDVRTSSTHQ